MIRFAGWFCFAFSISAVAAEGLPPVELRVLVYNYAEAPAALVGKAEEVASKIFREADVAATWEICAGPGTRERGCSTSSNLATVYLRLLPQAMTKRVRKGELQFGFAPLPAGGSPGVHAYVYFNRVKELAEQHLVIVPQLLGQIMAHEIGHLLLGSNNHTRQGLMRAQWTGDKLKEANVRLAYFSRKQAARARASVAARGQLTQVSTNR
ncbi:MAG: hypothetical protein GY953_51035 [bacterium]|nr:hypothetical protein [bacterium]